MLEKYSINIINIFFFLIFKMIAYKYSTHFIGKDKGIALAVFLLFSHRFIQSSALGMVYCQLHDYIKIYNYLRLVARIQGVSY